MEEQIMWGMNDSTRDEFIKKLLAKYPKAFDLPNTKVIPKIARALNVPEDEFKDMSLDDFDDYIKSKNIPDNLWYGGEVLPKLFSSRLTPDWMAAVNEMYSHSPNTAKKYLDELINGDEVDLEHWDPNKIERDKHDAEAAEAMKKEAETWRDIMKKMGGSKEIIRRIRSSPLYIPANVTDRQILDSPYASMAAEDMENDYYDNEAKNRGIKYPQLKLAKNDYLEDYLVDDYGKPIENPFDNNMAWFKSRFDIPAYSTLEEELNKVLTENRKDLSQRNLLKALAPDEEGGLF